MRLVPRRQVLRIGCAAALTAWSVVGCGREQGATDSRSNHVDAMENQKMKTTPDLTVKPFLMFTGDAEEAMHLYVEVFPNAEIVNIEKYGPNQDGPEGSVRVATMSLNGHRVMCIDSPVKPEFGFTPAMSLYVASDDADAIERYFHALSEGGEVLMPLGEYPFSKKFAWINDRFGVSWQLATT
jgi:predicted 3-demethylubiquinone-9 3-methyltransferase (glyoxalase superfamily)